MELTRQPRQGLSQEALKLIACVTMLIDHIGVTLVHGYLFSVAGTERSVFFYNILRIIGRVAFPIFCFLLVEGACHTRNPKKYALRLAVGAVLSEIPFDLVADGRITWGHQSVMVTLLLGYGMLLTMEHCQGWNKLIPILPFYLAAEWLHTDYAGEGILLIAMLELTRGTNRGMVLRLACFAIQFTTSTKWNIGYNIMFPVTQCAALAIIPIFFYGGYKRTYSKAVQWAFYLFYPVHLLILWLLKVMLFG